MPRDPDSYNLPTCIAIAAAPLGLALLIAYFADPRGVILFEVRPVGWFVDYLIIWPLVWVCAEILHSAKWMWFDPDNGVDLRTALRLSGGFMLIYVCIWLCIVPVVHEAAVRYPFLPIDRPSYSQIFRFLFGVAGGVSILVIVRLVRERKMAGD